MRVRELEGGGGVGTHCSDITAQYLHRSKGVQTPRFNKPRTTCAGSGDHL